MPRIGGQSRIANLDIASVLAGVTVDDCSCVLGHLGFGKTHLSIALARKAFLAGYTMQSVTATTLVAMLAKAYGERRLDEKLLALPKPNLLIVDELGYLPPETDAAHLVFQFGQPPLRKRRHAYHVEPKRRRMGHGVR